MAEKLPTDTERREVARRLRRFVTDDSVYADVDACRVLHSIGLYYKDIDRIYFSGFDVARLADLIDPDCAEGRYSVARTVRPVDRDALLAVAETLEDCAGRGSDLTTLGYSCLAKRIREACGEVER